VVLVKQAVGEIGPKVEFLVRTPGVRIAIDRKAILIAREKIGPVRHAVDRVGFAQRPIGRIGIGKKRRIQLAQIETARRRVCPAILD